MRTPNDKKRKNTNSGAETRNRKRNLKYVHVSKRILEVPVHIPDCDIFQTHLVKVDTIQSEVQNKPCSCLTNIKEFIPERNGRTYKNKKKNKHEREKDRSSNPQGS